MDRWSCGWVERWVFQVAGGGGGVVNVRGSPAFSDILPPGVLTSHSLAAPPVPGSGNARQTRSCPRGVCGGGAAVLQHRVGTITG